MQKHPKFNMDAPLVSFRGKDKDDDAIQWTGRNAVEGLQIFGGIGSGKSSGSGRTIALKFLSAGFGGLVLTVKPDEKEEWLKYCQQTGRENDLIIVEPDGAYQFNFLDYESAQGGGNALTENIVDVLKTVIKAGEEKEGSGTDPFWENALDMLIFNVIDLCKLAYGSVSLQQMYDIVQSLPKTQKDGSLETIDRDKPFYRALYKADLKVDPQVEAWAAARGIGGFNQLDKANKLAYVQEAAKDLPDVRLLNHVRGFFFGTFAKLAERTRSVVDFTFSGFLFRLLREPVYSLFCNKASTFTPEDSINGKIILLNLPVKTYHKIGRDVQVMFKYIWQRAMEKREIKEDTPLVFLWADEAQNFLHEHDPDFQATTRSSRVATVYISQNIPNYNANMGTNKAEYKVNSFLGTLNTKIFHANADTQTNRYASELIGDGFYQETSKTSGFSGQMSMSKTRSLRADRIVRPEVFSLLKTGGPANDFVTQAYIHIQGLSRANGRNFQLVNFRQNYNPNNN